MVEEEQKLQEKFMASLDLRAEEKAGGTAKHRTNSANKKPHKKVLKKGTTK